MGKGLSKTELTGLILLALIVVAVTGGSLLLKSCQPQVQSSMENLEVIDSVKDEKSSPASSSKKPGARKKKSRKRKSATPKSPKIIPVRPDPFADTIPTYD